MLIITPAVRGRLGRKIPGAQGDAGEKTQMGLRHPRSGCTASTSTRSPSPHRLFQRQTPEPQHTAATLPCMLRAEPGSSPPHRGKPYLHVPRFGGRGFKKAIKVRWGHNGHGTRVLTRRRDARMVWTWRRGHVKTQRGCSVYRPGRAFSPGPTWAQTPSLQNQKQTPPTAQDALSWQPLQSNTRGKDVTFEESQGAFLYWRLAKERLRTRKCVYWQERLPDKI